MDVKGLLGDSYKEGMTVEELTKALEGVEIPTDQTAELERLKGIISDKNTEAADWKKKYRDTLDEATKKAQEEEEAKNSLLEQVKTLQKEKLISNYKASYIAMGYDESLAEETANALADNNTAKVFENQKKHLVAEEQRIRADVLRSSPRPDGGTPSDGGGDDESLKLAKQIGKTKAEANNSTQSVLQNYLK